MGSLEEVLEEVIREALEAGVTQPGCRRRTIAAFNVVCSAILAINVLSATADRETDSPSSSSREGHWG